MRNNTILIVDDEEDIRDVLEICLADMGFDVIGAENGQDATEKFKARTPQIVITDIKMPDIGGIELLKEIKQDTPDTEVIMITGHGDMELAVESLKHKAIDFIKKPISPDALEIAVRRAKESIISRRQLNEYMEKLENMVLEKTNLQNHLASLGMMIGSISHGVKGLLTRMDGGIYLLESALKHKKAESIDESMDIVKDTINRVKKMIFDILYYAKDRQPDIQAVEVSLFIDDLTKGMADKIRRSGIEFNCKTEEIEGGFEVDAEQLQSALINIIENARDACLADQAKTGHQITLKATCDEEKIYMKISDNGTGMDLETREKIFDLFFSTKGNRGTGFGLFITDSIIRQHNGDISVHSVPAKGTDFNISIPRKHHEVNSAGHNFKEKNTEHKEYTHV